MQTIGNRRRSADIRKCALIAAFISAVSVVALETAGSTLKVSYADLEGTLSPVNPNGSLAVPPTATSPR